MCLCFLATDNDAKWSNYLAYVGIEMQFCSQTSSKDFRCELCIPLSVCTCCWATAYQRAPLMSHLACAHTVSHPCTYKDQKCGCTQWRRKVSVSSQEKHLSWLLWRVSHWLIDSSCWGLLSGMNTDDIFIFLEFSRTRLTLCEGGSIFLLCRVWGGWENRGRKVEVTYPNHRRIWNISGILVNAVPGIFHS